MDTIGINHAMFTEEIEFQTEESLSAAIGVCKNQLEFEARQGDDAGVRQTCKEIRKRIRLLEGRLRWMKAVARKKGMGR